MNILKKPKFITKNILILSFVSFFTDIASEMLYPVMPLFLQEAGYSLLAIGFLEGMAEAISGLNKVFIGAISDKWGHRKLFVQVGYGISAIAKPAIAFFPTFWFVFAMRFLDRVGKGIRTSPRDAILVAESDEKYRGRVFGFHRAFDSTGAMIGPFISFIFLIFFKSNYSGLFLFALLPGLAAIFATSLLRKEKTSTVKATKKPQSLKNFLQFWPQSSPTYKKLIIGFLLLAILNSSNVFLLLRAKELGIDDLTILGSYIFYNLIYAVVSYPVGVISDKLSFKYVFIFGLLIFSLVYGLFAYGLSTWMLFAAFGLYGIFSAISDATATAWLSLHIPPEYKATGLGLNLSLGSIAFLIASLFTALLWQNFGASLTFNTISLGSFMLVFYFWFYIKNTQERPITIGTT